MTIALDSGAEANCITVRECRRLNVPILPSNHTAVAVDKKTQVQVVGEIRTNFERNGIDFYFEGLVCPKLANEIIGGVPFLKKNKITQELNDNRISVNKMGKIFHIMEIPEFSPSQSPIQSRIVFTEAKHQSVLPNDYIEVKLSPEFHPDQSYLLKPPSDNPDNEWVPQEVHSVGNIIRISNFTDRPIMLPKHTQVLRIQSTHSANNENIDVQDYKEPIEYVEN